MNTISDDNIGSVVVWKGILEDSTPLVIIKTKNVNMYDEICFQVLKERTFTINLPLEHPVILKYDNESR